MSERDELADLIEDAIDDTIYNTADAPPSLTGMVAHHAAEAVLAAGYRKPRTIATIEELDALPLCSIVMNNGSNPHAWQKRTDLYVGDAWYLTSDTDYGMDSYAIFEDGDTATVLYEPEASK